MTTDPELAALNRLYECVVKEALEEKGLDT